MYYYDKMPKSQCKFCEIAEGKAECFSVYESRDEIAFLDIRPLFHGHLLLIPKSHVETIMDLPTEYIPTLFTTAKLLSIAVQEAMSAEGIFMAINNGVSQSVPHLHIHIVPRRKKDGLKGFFWPRTSYDNKEIEEVQRKIKETVDRLSSLG
jgi:histidine triad (HIT) family protein